MCEIGNVICFVLVLPLKTAKTYFLIFLQGCWEVADAVQRHQQRQALSRTGARMEVGRIEDKHFACIARVGKLDRHWKRLGNFGCFQNFFEKNEKHTSSCFKLRYKPPEHDRWPFFVRG